MCANTPSSLQLLQQQMDQDHPVSCVWSSPEVPQAGRQARYAPQACTLCVQSKMTCSGRSRGAQAFEELSQAFAGQPAGQASSEPDVQLDIQVKQASEVKTCRAKSSHCHWWAVICCNSCAGSVSPANCHEAMLMHSNQGLEGLHRLSDERSACSTKCSDFTRPCCDLWMCALQCFSAPQHAMQPAWPTMPGVMQHKTNSRGLLAKELSLTSITNCPPPQDSPTKVPKPRSLMTCMHAGAGVHASQGLMAARGPLPGGFSGSHPSHHASPRAAHRLPRHPR